MNIFVKNIQSKSVSSMSDDMKIRDLASLTILCWSPIVFHVQLILIISLAGLPAKHHYHKRNRSCCLISNVVFAACSKACRFVWDKSFLFGLSSQGEVRSFKSILRSKLTRNCATMSVTFCPSITAAAAKTFPLTSVKFYCVHWFNVLQN